MNPDKKINNINDKKKLIDFKLPPDLAKKGKEMMDIYYNLFILENFLRIFIERVAQNNFGDLYWEKLTLKKDIQEKIFFLKKRREYL